MQIVILAAGRGTRMNTLTVEKPKPLLNYKGKNLLEHKLDILPSNTTEIVFVIGYLGDQIKEYFKDSYKGIPIQYIEQKEMNGTAGALWICQDILIGSFMILMADDIYGKEDLDKLSQTKPNEWALLAYPDKPGLCAGKIVKDTNGMLSKIYNDFDGTSSYNLTYTGACILTPEIFTRPIVPISSKEFGLPQSFTQFVDSKNIRVLEAENWIRITAPEDLK